MRTIYAVMKDSDTTEGRGRYVMVGHFTSPVDAEVVASRYKYIGGLLSASKVEPVNLFDSEEEFDAFNEWVARSPKPE